MSLGVEEVHHWNPEQVQPGEEEVTATLDALEHNGIHQRGHANPNCPSRDPEPVALRT